jgi:hypothetical protein
VEEPFDPVKLARERREGERRSAQVTEAYEQMYGGHDRESGMDKFLTMADSLRGLAGGLFGPVVGSVLDVVSGLRDAGAESAKRSKHEQLLDEAEGTTSAAEGAAKTSVPHHTKAPPAKPSTDIGVEASAAEEEGFAAAGGESSIAAAAGPVGMAVAAGMAIDNAVKGAIKSTIGLVGGLATDIASPNADPAEPIAKMGEAATAAGDKLLGFGQGLVVVGESLKALSSVMEALDATSKRYGEYSPEIAQASAVAEIRQTMGDFRRAQEVSGEMAKYIIAQSDLQQRFEDMKVKLLTQMMPLITHTVELIEVIVAAGDGSIDAIKGLTYPLTHLAQMASEMVGMQRDDRLPDMEDPTTQIINPKFGELPSMGGWAPDR